MRWAPVLLVLLASSLHADDAPVVVETDHYRLEAEAAPEEARELGRVLEAAWGGFEEYFGKRPKLRRGERLRVRFFASRERWAAGLEADGLGVPTHAGGYYAPGTKTAYVFRQPTVYFTRVLFVHEAAHQFHYLARTHNGRPSAGWYREGVAEYLSWHLWDGERIVLGVRPPISLKDYAAKALAAVEAEDFDLEAIVEDRDWPGYAVAWALYRYLATGRGGEPLKGFETFCRKMDAGGGVGPLFRRAFRDPKAVLEGLRGWLRAEQQPWEWTYNEWDARGRRRLLGFAGVVSVCRLREPVERLSAALEVPVEGPWQAGLLLGFASGDDYVVALVNQAGRLRVNRRANGRWQRLGDEAVELEEGASVLSLEARRKADGVHVRVGTATFGPYPGPGATLGLALDGCRVVFADLDWE